MEYEKPSGITAELYEYQKRGYAWMHYMLLNSHGCILGDEMGLGKTLQAMADINNMEKWINIEKLLNFLV